MKSMCYRPFLLIIITATLLSGCKSYERFPVPPYNLREPALDSPYLDEWLSSGWQINEEPLNAIGGSNEVLTLAQDRTEVVLFHPDSSQQLLIAHRHIVFEDVLNFRDIGGIRTEDGRQIRWGKIYRSGKLEKLKSKEFEAMKKLGIKTVVDLRTVGEVRHEPDEIPANQGVNWFHVPISGITDEELEQTKKEIKKQSVEEFDGAEKWRPSWKGLLIRACRTLPGFLNY